MIFPLNPPHHLPTHVLSKPSVEVSEVFSYPGLTAKAGVSPSTSVPSSPKAGGKSPRERRRALQEKEDDEERKCERQRRNLEREEISSFCLKRHARIFFQTDRISKLKNKIRLCSKIFREMIGVLALQ